jgi:hypothetical protein
MKFFEDSFGEASADVTDGFVGVGRSIMACQQEGAVPRCAFTFAVVGT